MAETGAPWLLECEVEQARDYLLSSGLWSDCTFVVGSGTNQAVMQAHKLVLAIESPVFEAMFYGGLSERNDPIVPIPDVPPEAFRALLQYIYTYRTNIDSIDMACDLWYAADKYIMPNLVKICYTHIWSFVGPRNVCQAYQVASLFDKETIVDKCIQIISTNTKEVLNDSSFEDVELKTVIAVCSLSHLNVDSELDLFLAVSRYAEAEQRRQGWISPVDREPPSKKLCQSLQHTSTSEEMALLLSTRVSSDTSPAAELHSKPPTEVVKSEPTADKDNFKKEELTIRGALQKIRFLSLSAQEFAEGPARPGLLTEAESFALRSNIASRDSPVPMPAGFSASRERRQPPNVDDGPMAKPRPKPCTGSRSVAASTLLPTPAKIVRSLMSSEREVFEDAARAARYMTCADADGTENLNLLVAAGGIAPLVAALNYPWTGVQYDAAWAITNIACGEHAAKLPDAVPVLVDLLGRGGAVAEQAAWALGNIAVYNSYARDAVLDAGAVPALLAHMQPSTPSAPLGTYVRTYRMICQKDIYTRWDEWRHYEVVSGVPYIENLLVLADGQVLAQACWALHHLVGGNNANSELFTATLAARVTALLRPAAATPDVQTAALAALRRMLITNGSTADRCHEAGCLDHIVIHLKCGNPLHVAYAAQAVSNILAGAAHRFQQVLDKGILDALVPALTEGNQACKLPAASAIDSLCDRGSPEQLSVLAASAALEPYCLRLAAGGNTCYNVLCGLRDLLKNVEQNTRPDLLLKLREIGVPQLLVPLEQNESRWTRELADDLLRTYFSNDQ